MVDCDYMPHKKIGLHLQYSRSRSHSQRWFRTSGVALIAKFCVNIAFWGAIHILATSLCHHTQNDWTPIQQVTAHWWLPRHSALDLFAKSMLSQWWLCTPPRHYKSSQWRAESGQQNKRATASYRYFGLYGDTPPPPPPHHWSMRIIVSSALCLWIKSRCTMIYFNRILMNPYLEE